MASDNINIPSSEDKRWFSGDDETIAIEVYQETEENNAKDLSGGSVTFTLYDTDGTIAFTKSVGSGITITGVDNHILDIDINESDTADLGNANNSGFKYYDIELVMEDSTGKTQTINGQAEIYHDKN